MILLRACSMPFDVLERFRAARSTPLLEEALALEEALEAEAPALCDALHEAAGDRPQNDPEGARRRLALIAVRRDIHNRRPVAEERLRHATASLEPSVAARVERYAALARRADALLRDYRDAFRHDLDAARAALIRLAREPLFEEGVRLASRSLLGRLRDPAFSELVRWGHAQTHVAAKAAAYAVRFTTKTSPNAVFCATALASALDGEARVEGRGGVARADYLLSVVEARKIVACLAMDPSAGEAVTPRPNPTLRESGGAWTFWRPASLRNPDDSEVLSRAKENAVARAFLEEASARTLAAAALVEAVARRCGIGAAELRPFYEELVRRGLLLAEVEVPFLSRRPLADLAATCRAAGSSPPWLAEVERIEQAVESLSRLPCSERPAAMDRIERELAKLPCARALKPDEVFRCDTASPLRVAIPKEAIARVVDAVGLYARLFAAIYPERLYRLGWARRFLEKHPPDTDVPLLDVYHGVFEPQQAPAPRLPVFPEPPGPAAAGPDGLAARERFARLRDRLAAAARDAAAAGLEEVELAEDELESAVGPLPDPSWSAGVLFQLAAPDAAAIAAGRGRIVLDAIFSGAGFAMSRFWHLHGEGAPLDDNPIVRTVREAWSALERAGAILAEVTYMHGARTANAGLRPPIFRHEIELPGETPTPGADVLPLRDLSVRWDSARQRFVIRSASRGLEVIPVVNSGISPEGFVAFLVAVGQQGMQPVSLFPGFDVEGIRRWPRFTMRGVVLTRGRWVFGTEEVPGGGGRPPGRRTADADSFTEAARWRRRNDLPRHVFVHTTADPKPFYVDLESPLLVDLLRRAVAAHRTRNAARVYVTEMLPGPQDLWVADAAGRYATEFHIQAAGGPRPTP